MLTVFMPLRKGLVTCMCSRLMLIRFFWLGLTIDGWNSPNLKQYFREEKQEYAHQEMSGQASRWIQPLTRQHLPKFKSGLA